MACRALRGDFPPKNLEAMLLSESRFKKLEKVIHIHSCNPNLVSLAESCQAMACISLKIIAYRWELAI